MTTVGKGSSCHTSGIKQFNGEEKRTAMGVQVRKHSMRGIPKKMRQEMADDPWYKFCCLKWEGGCSTGGTQWHHHLIHKGRQVNEKFCILSLCVSHHQKITDGDQELTRAADKVMCERATDEQIKKYNLEHLCR